MSFNTICIKAGRGRREEAAMYEIAKPGNFVIKDSNGLYKKNNLTTGADIELAVLIEDSLQGKLITDAYAAGDVGFAYKPLRGDYIYVRVPASASAIVIGDRLQLDATGCAIKLASGTPKFTAEEALDNSGGGSEAFIKVSVN